ncbi:acyl carrier protein [Ruegeria arenilitoris]|uniref:acyl carrier protein n=1 Tax=Ruegeria arenilitoris TaxID=1173585 RepID=UPI00147E489A|nr:acyl carrier protein [Ruegeria arenilitoris]
MVQTADPAEVIHRIVQECVGAQDDIDTSHPLLQSGVVDSLSLLQIVMGIQSELGVNVELEEINEQNFRDIDSIAALVSQKS